jgi:HEPN domain-containing protein
MSVDSRIPADWFARADQDLAASRQLLKEPDTTFLIPAAMLLQQAVEKYLKGFLLAQGRNLKRTHDLLDLLDEAIPFAPELSRFDAASIKITEYYTEQRYPPLVSSELTREELLLSLAEAEEMCGLLKHRLT